MVDSGDVSTEINPRNGGSLEKEILGMDCDGDLSSVRKITEEGERRFDVLKKVPEMEDSGDVSNGKFPEMKDNRNLSFEKNHRNGQLWRFFLWKNSRNWLQWGRFLKKIVKMENKVDLSFELNPRWRGE